MHLSESPTHLFYIRQDLKCHFPRTSHVSLQQNSFCAMSQILAKILLLNGMQNAQCDEEWK